MNQKNNKIRLKLFFNVQSRIETIFRTEKRSKFGLKQFKKIKTIKKFVKRFLVLKTIKFGLKQVLEVQTTKKLFGRSKFPKNDF